MALVAILALATACSSAATGQSPPGAPAAPAPGEGRADGDDGGEPGAGGEEAPPPAQLAGRLIIRTGELTLRVEEVGATLGQVRALALELDGFVSGSRASSSDEVATLTLRIPAEAFDRALERLREMALEVVVEATREEDVTTQVIDLEARIENLEASEEQYRRLVDRAETVEEILAVQRRLDEIRGQIEQLSAQLAHISRQAALSTLTVTLVPEDRPVEAVTTEFDPGATFDQALAALVAIGQGLVAVGIWFGMVWLPILVVLALLAFAALRGAMALRRRIAPAGEPPAA